MVINLPEFRLAGGAAGWPMIGYNDSNPASAVIGQDAYGYPTMIRATFTALVSAFLVVLFLVPALLISPIYRSRRLTALIAHIWACIVIRLAGARLTIEGAEHVADGVPRFFMGNHQSALDIPILIRGLSGYVRFMAKSTLFRIPIFGWYLARYGYVPIDRAHPRVAFRALNRMLEHLHRNPISFAVFPEGTRSGDGRLLPFHRGTMKIGQRSGLDIVPFVIDGSVNVYDRYRFACRPGTVRLVFARPIPAEEVATMTPGELHDRVRHTIARQLGQPCDQPIGDTSPVIAAEGT